MSNETDRLYFKVGCNVVSVPKEDLTNQIIDCSRVEVLTWTEEEPFYKFEHNDLAQHIAETENIECFDGFETPDTLIDKEIVEALKKRADKAKKESTKFYRLNDNAYVIGGKAHTLAMARARAKREELMRRIASQECERIVEERLGINKKTGKVLPGKVEVVK